MEERAAVRSCRRVRVCFVGQDSWVRQLTAAVSRHGRWLLPSYVGVAHGPFVRGVLEFRNADIIVRVGLRPGARTVRGKAFDALWTLARLLNLRSPVACYWIGTDVLRAVEDVAGGWASPFWRSSARWRHIAAAPWLAEELEEHLGIASRTVLFPVPLPHVDPLPPLPATFSVLSYIPDNRHAFYGGEMVYAAARELPTVIFSVVGGVGNWVDRPLPNLRFHGWCKDMLAMYRSSSVVVRLVRHDAVGGTLREGLALGRYVVYTYEVPHTHHVEFGDADALIRVLAEYEQLHRRGELRLNKAGAEFALREWNEPRLVSLLETELLAMMAETDENCLGKEQRGQPGGFPVDAWVTPTDISEQADRSSSGARSTQMFQSWSGVQRRNKLSLAFRCSTTGWCFS